MERKFYQFARSKIGWPRLITTIDPTAVERESLPHLIIAVLPFQAGGNGLPVTGEFQRVSRIEDKVVATLESQGALHLGHITGEGTMKVAFYGRRPGPASVTVKTGLLKSQSILLETNPDPKWTWFDEEMKASDMECEMSRNAQLHGLLRDKGDDPSKERPVDFTFNFPSESLRESFLLVVSANGYERDDENLRFTDGHDLPFGCDVKLVTTIEREVIATHCAHVRAEAASHGGEFDGWGCPVTP